MAIKIEEGNSKFPTVVSVNAVRHGGGFNIFLETRVEGKPANVEVHINTEQWATLKTLIDGPKG